MVNIANITDEFFRNKMAIRVLLSARDKAELQMDRIELLFQYYPIRMTERIEVKYEEVDVIGGSHPVYQWVNTKGRSFDFTFVFASDVVINQLSGNRGTSVNIRDALNALRFLVFPRYDRSSATVFGAIAPTPIEISLPNSGVSGQFDTIRGIITDLSIEYLKFFPNGEPRYVECDMSVSELINLPTDFRFTSRKEYEISLKNFRLALLGEA
jgi:hypothetical protein